MLGPGSSVDPWPIEPAGFFNINPCPSPVGLPSPDTVRAGRRAESGGIFPVTVVDSSALCCFLSNAIQGVTGMDGQPGPKGNVVSLGGLTPTVTVKPEGDPRWRAQALSPGSRWSLSGSAGGRAYPDRGQTVSVQVPCAPVTSTCCEPGPAKDRSPGSTGRLQRDVLGVFRQVEYFLVASFRGRSFLAAVWVCRQRRLGALASGSAWGSLQVPRPTSSLPWSRLLLPVWASSSDAGVGHLPALQSPHQCLACVSSRAPRESPAPRDSRAIQVPR